MEEDDLEEKFSEKFSESDGQFRLPKRGPIATSFYPFDSDEPFSACTMCQRIFSEDEDYIIEKAIKGSDVIFEIAMCLSCAEDIRKQLSRDSLERIEAYMSRVDFNARAQHFISQPSSDIQDYLGHCVVSGKRIDPKEEHQIYAYCSGREMMYAAMPYAISGEIMEEIQQLLSPETKQELDNFMDQYLIPDDLRDLIKGRPVFI